MSTLLALKSFGLQISKVISAHQLRVLRRKSVCRPDNTSILQSKEGSGEMTSSLGQGDGSQ